MDLFCHELTPKHPDALHTLMRTGLHTSTRSARLELGRDEHVRERITQLLAPDTASQALELKRIIYNIDNVGTFPASEHTGPGFALMGTYHNGGHDRFLLTRLHAINATAPPNDNGTLAIVYIHHAICEPIAFEVPPDAVANPLLLLLEPSPAFTLELFHTSVIRVWDDTGMPPACVPRLPQSPTYDAIAAAVEHTTWSRMHDCGRLCGAPKNHSPAPTQALTYTLVAAQQPDGMWERLLVVGETAPETSRPSEPIGVVSCASGAPVLYARTKPAAKALSSRIGLPLVAHEAWRKGGATSTSKTNKAK